MSGALSWGLQAWDLLRWAWPSHRTHPDFGTLEPFTQFWQGLWESVVALGCPPCKCRKMNSWATTGFWLCISVSGEESLLWKGCFVMCHVEILIGLERGMSWSTSGSVRRSPQREMEGMVSYMGQSDVFAQQNLFVASFFSSSRLLSAYMIAQTTLSILCVSLSWLDYTTSMSRAEKATGFFIMS